MVDSAKTEPWDHIEEIKALFNAKRSPTWGFHPKVLHVIFLAFDKPPPSAASGQITDARSTEYAVDVLYILTNFMLISEFYATEPNFAERCITLIWPKLFAWIKFFLYGRRDILFGTAEVQPMELVHDFFVAMWASMAGSNDGREFSSLFCVKIQQTPGALQILLEIWVRQRDIYPQGRYYELASFVRALFVVGSDFSVDIDRLRARFGFKPATFALMLIRPLRDLIYGNPKPHGISYAMLARSTFSAYDHFAMDTPILFQDLIDEGLLVDLMHYISTFINQGPDGHGGEARDFELACYLIYRVAFATDGSKQWVQAAIRYRLI
ncbi:hypothetical protein H0H92_010705 [Tricholoma furcatifolium]|nr:hypothetical protein H0H92_010705 [Tricholoma furcatifolium]